MQGKIVFILFYEIFSMQSLKGYRIGTNRQTDEETYGRTDNVANRKSCYYYLDSIFQTKGTYYVTACIHKGGRMTLIIPKAVGLG